MPGSKRPQVSAPGAVESSQNPEEGNDGGSKRRPSISQKPRLLDSQACINCWMNKVQCDGVRPKCGYRNRTGSYCEYSLPEGGTRARSLGETGEHSPSLFRPTQPADPLPESCSLKYPIPVSRTTVACDACRTGKRKCDGSSPICRSCQHRGIQCQYTPHTRSRGCNVCRETRRKCNGLRPKCKFCQDHNLECVYPTPKETTEQEPPTFEQEPSTSKQEPPTSEQQPPRSEQEPPNPEQEPPNPEQEPPNPEQEPKRSDEQPERSPQPDESVRAPTPLETSNALDEENTSDAQRTFLMTMRADGYADVVVLAAYEPMKNSEDLDYLPALEQYGSVLQNMPLEVSNAILKRNVAPTQGAFLINLRASGYNDEVILAYYEKIEEFGDPRYIPSLQE